jgi:hypothetical protein
MDGIITSPGGRGKNVKDAPSASFVAELVSRRAMYNSGTGGCGSGVEGEGRERDAGICSRAFGGDAEVSGYRGG